MKQDFIKAVEGHDVAMVRLALANELLLDPRGTSFGEMLAYAQERMPELFEENMTANYSVPPQGEWDNSFMFVVKNDLDANFSKEKLAFFETVVKVVAKEKINRLNEEDHRRKEQSRQEEAGRTTAHESHTYRRKNQASNIVTVGGAVLTVIGICAGKTILSIVGGVVFVGGVLLKLRENKKI